MSVPLTPWRLRLPTYLKMLVGINKPDPLRNIFNTEKVIIFKIYLYVTYFTNTFAFRLGRKTR